MPTDDAIVRAEEIAARMKKLGVKSFSYEDGALVVSAEFLPDYLSYGPVAAPAGPPSPGSED